MRVSSRVYYNQSTVKVNYTAVPKAGGSLTTMNETFGAVEGAPKGSTATAKEGYTFIGWFADEACTTPVNGAWLSGEGNNVLTPCEKDSDNCFVNATYYALFEAKQNTPYKVEHYLEKSDGSFFLKETEDFTGTTDTTVTAAEKSYPGYTFDANNANNKVSGKIAGNGSLVLK